MSDWHVGTLFVLRHAGFPFDWLEALGLSTETIRAIDATLDAPEPEAWPSIVEEDLGSLRLRLQARARDPRIREAVFLSNPDMYVNVWRSYADRAQVPANARFRRVERQVYTYLQRLCAKNETTSFFGPMGYGRVRVETNGFRVSEAGPQRRRTMLAHWAVLALSEACSADPRLADDVPVWANPTYQLQGNVLSSPLLNGRAIRLTSNERQVAGSVWLQPSSVAAIAEQCEISPSDVRQSVARLAKAGAVVTTFALPSDGFDGLGHLRAALAGLPPSPARAEWDDRFADLERLRAEFESAGLNGRVRLLPQLEAAFSHATGQQARRGAGEFYADRLVIFEEASSPFAIEVGKDVLERLEEALAPALDVSCAYGDLIQATHTAWAAGLVERAGGELDLLTYAVRAADETSPTAGFAQGDLSADLLDAIRSGTTTSDARYALPDVCLGMSDPSEAADGEWTVVLGRIHHHLLVWNWLGAFATREEFERDARAWLDRESDTNHIVGLAVARRNKGFYLFPGPRVALTGAHSDGAMHATDFTVKLEHAKPVLVDRKGRRSLLYLPLADLTSYPPFTALSAPLVAHARFHDEALQSDRVIIGGTIYQRARWTVPANAVLPGRGLGALRSLRRVARDYGLPRFTFVRTEAERKPYLVDSHSPFAAEMLQHIARASSHLTFEEMLPGPEGLWLKDREGRYTSELRVQTTRRAESLEEAEAVAR